MSDPLDNKLSQPTEGQSLVDDNVPEIHNPTWSDEEETDREPNAELEHSSISNMKDTDTDLVQYSSKQRRLEYLRNGTFADCEVHVESTSDNADIQSGNVCYKKFHCHRIFLGTASDKLEQDIYENKQWNGVLQIDGVSPESVEIFLEFVYTFEVISSNVQLQFVGDIFILSCAYNMPELMVKFSNQLKDKEWPLEVIFPAFDLAFRHNISDLEYACLVKILENAPKLVQEPTIMKLQIYALNYVIQLWLITEALSPNELVHLLQQYQSANNIKFSNFKKFPHFQKIIKYFPNALLNAEGVITKY